MSTGYAAYQIDESSRAELLRRFPPKYSDAVAHHITHKYAATKADVPPQPQEVNVVGYHDSGAMEVLVVQVDGRRFQEAGNDGGENFYHITLSLDRAQGVSPRNSNDALQKIAAEQGEAALCNLSEPFAVSVTPRLLVDTGNNGPQKSRPSCNP